MKVKVFTYFLASFIMLTAAAQNEYEALLFSNYNPNGTARFNAMGGAFGALGADLSVMATNPAGTGLYRKSEFGMSTAWTGHNVESDYYGSVNNARELSFQMANMGFITVNNTLNTDWKKINVGFAYNHLNDYNKSFVINGDNQHSSMLDLQAYFLNMNERDTTNNAYYMAGTVFKEGARYTNDYALYGEYDSYQQQKVKTSGYAGEYDLNLSTGYKDFLFVGATLGFQRINYSSYVEYSEKPYNPAIALVDFESFDYLEAKGSGFNLKLGMLFKPNHLIRVGVALHTPTLYNIKYNYWTDVYSTLNFTDVNESYTGRSPRGNYNWSFSSPAKFIASSAIVLGRLAIISADLEYVNYSKINLSSSDNFFETANSNIEKVFSQAINARLGAEVRFGVLSLRAGLAYLDSPYASNEPNADAFKMLYSAGFGINAGAVYFDASYQYAMNNEKYYMYQYASSKADLSSESNKFIASLGYRF